MTRGQVAWLAASFLIAFGINAQMKPEIDVDDDTAGSTIGTGTLELVLDGRSHELPLSAIHVFARDVPRTFGPAIEVRELLVRSPREDPETPPDLELFVDFAAPEVSADARDVELLRGRELAVLAEPPGRDRRSRIRLPGGSEPAEVVSGTLMITDTVPIDVEDGVTSWRVGARIDLQLRNGDAIDSISGRIKARLRWP